MVSCQEPDELRGSSPVLRGPRGEVPRGYSAGRMGTQGEARLRIIWVKPRGCSSHRAAVYGLLALSLAHFVA
jgi:hypothetical protein